MKKLLAALLAVAGLFCSASVFAQNVPSSYTANGRGIPQFNLNSAGSNYGQLNNQDSTNWSIGWGSSTVVNGTSVLTWNTSNQVLIGTTIGLSGAEVQIGSAGAAFIVKANGWLESKNSQVPVVSACGTSPSAVVGSDQAGDVSVGAIPVLSCTLTFANVPQSIPHCFCSDRTSNVACNAMATATTVVLTGTGQGAGNASFNKGDALDYFCIGSNSL